MKENIYSRNRAITWFLSKVPYNPVGSTRYPYALKKKTKPTDFYLTSFIQINLKCTKEVQVKGKAIKLLEENFGGYVYDLAIGKDSS